MNPSNAPGIKAASGIADTGAIEGHVDKFVFHPGFAGFVGIGELEDMRTSRAAVASMTGWGLAVAVYTIRVATRAVNGEGGHKECWVSKATMIHENQLIGGTTLSIKVPITFSCISTEREKKIV